MELQKCLDEHMGGGGGLAKKAYGGGLAKKAPNPFMSVYYPIWDMTDEQSLELTSYFQYQIGILHWIVDLG